MYFMTMRSRRMVFYAGSMATGAIVGNLCGGYISFRLGWFALFEIVAAVSAAAFLGLIFFAAETIYDRPSSLPTQTNQPTQTNLPRASRYFPRAPESAPHLTIGTLPSMRMTLPSRFLDSIKVEQPGPVLTFLDDDSSTDISSSMAASHSHWKPPHSRTATMSTHATARTRYRPYTFSRSLRLGMNRGNPLYQFTRPWSTLRLPSVWVAALQYAGLVGSLGVVSLMGPSVLLAPPYFWGVNASLLSIGPLVGVVCGGLYSYFLPDLRVMKKAVKNSHGYAEAEARIPVILPSLALATAGLLSFGFCADYPDTYQWVGIEVACGMVSFGLVQVATVWFSYFIDAYEQLASDCLAMICILRGVFPFAFTFFSSDWVKEDGFLVPFGGFTVIMGVFSLLIVPFLWTGKRMRIATAPYVHHNQ
ncbi:hypothetical protein QBC39DRAFT_365681 [Podospora conica]|nr:hypothetical protein QBC39DRAFT_365681 [Schizothecium conicum]